MGGAGGVEVFDTAKAKEWSESRANVDTNGNFLTRGKRSSKRTGEVGHSVFVLNMDSQLRSFCLATGGNVGSVFGAKDCFAVGVTQVR